MSHSRNAISTTQKDNKELKSYDSFTDQIEPITHFIAHSTTAMHMTGLHAVPQQLKYVGFVAETISEITHAPSESIVEKIVCGTGVAATKEILNETIATISGGAVGSLASLGTTPIGGAVVGAATATGMYMMADKITTPIGKIVENTCYNVFEELRNSEDDHAQSSKSGLKDIIQPSINKAAEIIEDKAEAVCRQVFLSVNAIEENHLHWTRLHRAMYEGNIDEVEWLITNGAILKQDDHGHYPHQISSYPSVSQSTREKIISLIDPNYQEKDGLHWTALHRAVYEGNIAKVEWLIANGAILKQDDHGHYPHQISSYPTVSQATHEKINAIIQTKQVTTIQPTKKFLNSSTKRVNAIFLEKMKDYLQSEAYQQQLAAKQAKQQKKWEKRAAYRPSSMFDDFDQRRQRLKTWEQQSRAKVNMIYNNNIKSTGYTDSTNLQASIKKSREDLQKISREIDKSASACGQLGYQMLVDHLTQQSNHQVSSKDIFSGSQPKVMTPNPSIVNEIKKEISAEKKQNQIVGQANNGVDVAKKWPGCDVKPSFISEITNTAGRTVHYYDVSCPTSSGEINVFSGYTISGNAS